MARDPIGAGASSWSGACRRSTDDSKQVSKTVLMRHFSVGGRWWDAGMSISQLRATDGHLALAELEAARSSVRRALQVPATALSVDELTDGIAGVAVLRAQVAALELNLAAEADRRRVAQSLGAPGTDAWLAQLTGDTRAAAAGGLWLARRLQDTYHA